MAAGGKKGIGSGNDGGALVGFSDEGGVVVDEDAEGPARVGLIGSAVDPVVDDGAYEARVGVQPWVAHDPAHAEDVGGVVVGESAIGADVEDVGDGIGGCLAVGVDVDGAGEGVGGEHVEIAAAALGVLHLQGVVAGGADAEDVDDTLAAVVEGSVTEAGLRGLGGGVCVGAVLGGVGLEVSAAAIVDGGVEVEGDGELAGELADVVGVEGSAVGDVVLEAEVDGFGVGGCGSFDRGRRWRRAR